MNDSTGHEVEFDAGEPDNEVYAADVLERLRELEADVDAQIGFLKMRIEELERRVEVLTNASNR